MLFCSLFDSVKSWVIRKVIKLCQFIKTTFVSAFKDNQDLEFSAVLVGNLEAPPHASLEKDPLAKSWQSVKSLGVTLYSCYKSPFISYGLRNVARLWFLMSNITRFVVDSFVLGYSFVVGYAIVIFLLTSSTFHLFSISWINISAHSNDVCSLRKARWHSRLARIYLYILALIPFLGFIYFFSPQNKFLELGFCDLDFYFWDRVRCKTHLHANHASKVVPRVHVCLVEGKTYWWKYEIRWMRRKYKNPV